MKEKDDLFKENSFTEKVKNHTLDIIIIGLIAMMGWISAQSKKQNTQSEPQQNPASQIQMQYIDSLNQNSR